MLKELNDKDPAPYFIGFKNFQSQIVDKLNDITKEYGLPDYFSHNGNPKMQY